MTIDLKKDSEMTPLIGLFVAMVEENFLRLTRSLEGVSPDELIYTGLNHDANSIAQLLKHLAYVDLNWVYRIKGDAMPLSVERAYGPMVDENGQLPKVENRTLEDLLSAYEYVLEQLKEECRKRTDAEFQKTVAYEEGKTATIQWGIWHMADHSRYHQAHINQLRSWFKQECETRCS